MFEDNLTVANPWSSPITLGSDSYTPAGGPFTPALAAGTSPKNSGVVIPNITDGHSGGAPDRGAIISGLAIPNWGDQNSTPAPPGVKPNPPQALIAE